jgi:hypothetical protein
LSRGCTKNPNKEKAMISGNKERKILRFAFIDRCGSGRGWTSPTDGEEFIGIPYGWHTDSSTPHIEVQVDGVVVRVINVDDVSEIEFA